MIRLSETELKVLMCWENTSDDCNVFSFATASRESGVERTKIRRSVRALSRKGLLYYVRCSWSDEGEMMGAGYAPTDHGYKEISEREALR